MIHILNFESKIIDFFSTNDSNISVAEHTHNIEEDLETLVLTVGINRSENFRQRNRVLIEASDGRYREFIIQDTEDDLIEGETQVTCVASYLEDLSKAKPMPPKKYDNMTLDEMAFDVLRATGWELGYVDYMGIKDRSWTAYATPYEVLVMLKTTFKHEYEFLIEIEGNRVKKRVVNCVEPTNLFNGREIEYGKDLIGMTRTIDNSEVVTAYIGLGPEDDKGNRQVVEVVDDDAQEDLGLPENYLWGIYEPESENDSMTKERLTTLTRTALNKAKVAAVSYEVEAVDIHKQFPHELIQIGDKVRIKNRDMKPALYADARVLEIVTNLIDDTQTYKFGQVKEYNENTLRNYFNSLRAEFTKKLNDNINNLDTIISETVEGLDIFERKIFKGDTPPENPVNDALWYDTSNPDVAILRRYWNGQWIAATPEDVEQLGGMTREQILLNELNSTFSNLSIQHVKLLNDVYAIINSEYLVDNNIRNSVQEKLDNTITVYQQISSNLDSMTEETATIGKLMDTQALFLTYRQKLQTLYIAVKNAQIAINERFKLLQSQYTEEKFNEAMQGVAAAIGGTFNEETGQLIADIPNNDMLEEMRVTIEQSLSDLTQANQVKLQALQDGITQTNQRITNTNEELSAGITSVTKKVEGLQVGGRNLILDSKNSKFMPNNAGLGNAVQNSDLSWTVIPNDNKKLSIYFNLVPKVLSGGKLELGKEYTYSIDVTANINCELTYYAMNIETVPQKKVQLIAGQKTRVNFTFKPKDDVSVVAFILGISIENAQLTYDNLQLEKGNIATDWKQAIEDFKEVKVGGRNLLAKSTQEYLDPKLSYSTGIVVIDGKKANVFNNSNNIIYLNGTNYTLEEGETYTFSFYAKATKPIGMTQGVYINGQNRNFIKETIFSTNWKRYSFTFTAVGASKVGIHMYPIIKNSDGTFESFYVTDWQLEKGNVMTDITPSIEDTQAQITKAQQEATDAAKAYAEAQDNLKLVTAQAYADGVVDAEEQRAIQDAQTKLNQAKAYAETKATEAQNAANAYANNKASQAKEDATNAAKAYADAQDNLKAIETKAYADGIVDAEEQRAIDDATVKLTQAKTYAEQKATEAKNAANTNTQNQLAPIKSTVETQSADIKVLKEGIKLKADSSEVTKIYDNYLTPLQTQVNQQKATLDILPSQIAAKVSQSTYNADMNNVIGRLDNAEAETVVMANQIKDRVTINEYEQGKEETTQEITNAVDNVKVGGRNLLINSANISKAIDVTNSSILNQYWFANITSAHNNFQIGDEVTISFDVQMERGEYLKVYDSNQHFEYRFGEFVYNNIGNEIVRLSFTKKLISPTKTGNVWNLAFYNNNNGDRFIIKNIKIEKGNKVTDWSPAPEDTQLQINKAQQEATVAAKAYADAQDNLKAIETKAYADGVIDAEEQRAIADAQAKLSQAKTHAEQKANEAKNAANAYTDAKKSDVDKSLTQMQTSIEQNGRDILLKASEQDFNASKQTLSRVLTELVMNTTTGITLSYDENGGIQNFTIGPNGTLIDTKKLTIEAGDVSLRNGVFTVNKVNTKNVTIPREDGGVPTIVNGLDKQISTVTGMEPAFMSTFYIGNNIFATEIYRSGTWYGVFKRYASAASQDYARVNAYYFQHTRRYLRFRYVVHVGTDADDRGNTPTGIYMKVQEFGSDVGYRMDYLNLIATSQGGSNGIVNVEHVFDLGPPTGKERAFYILVKPNGEGVVGGSVGTDPRTWNSYSVCKFAFRPFELYG